MHERSGDQRLITAIVRQAVKDLDDRYATIEDRQSALAYFDGERFTEHCFLLGIDPVAASDRLAERIAATRERVS